MIDLKTAFEKVRAAFFQGKVPETIYEYRDFWVFDWKEDCECASMPAVWKESGEIFLFFPPDFQGKDPGNPRKIPLPDRSGRKNRRFSVEISQINLKSEEDNVL